MEALALERMLFFSDAVMAIAMTLLAVELRVPETAGDGGTSAVALLTTLRAPLIAMAFSFLLIGETWIDHHRICRQLRRTGRALPWWNLLLLLFVVLMPLASRLLQTQQSSAVTIYAGVYGGMGVAKLGFWIHAVKCRFVSLPLDVEGRSTSFRLWATPAVSLAIGLLASQGVAQAIWGFLALPGITYGLHRASLWSSR